MRKIERTGQFKRDYKRESKGQYSKVLDLALIDVLELILVGKPLPAKYRDHVLLKI
jgi:mRNA interferase YafQ